MKHFKTIGELHRSFGLTRSLNPMISLNRCTNNCTLSDSEFTGDFYLIGFKKLVSGVIMYGRTKYDHENGCMYFFKPRQVIQFKDLAFEQDGFLLYIHEDMLNGHPLHEDIKKYNYFDYETNEALHLSPREEEIIWDLYQQIDNEYQANPDEYSRDIMLTHVDSILKYAQRFYKRQFINRTDLSGKTVSKFTKTLSNYFEQGQLQKVGLPTVNAMAEQMNLSPRYLSDLLKQETGKTAIELIHIQLVNEAKHLLKTSDQTIAETAYTLGFENLPYFSRLFKKEVGITPNQFKQHSLN